MTELSFNRADFECVTTERALNAWVKRCNAAPEVCFDTETTGLDARSCDLVGYALAVQAGGKIEACYIPVGHQPRVGKQLSNDIALPKIRAIVQSGKPIVGANLLFDMRVMAQKRYATTIVNAHDTQLQSYALTGNLHREHGMDALAARILGYKTIKFSDVVNERVGIPDFSYVNLPHATRYSAEDAAVTLTIHYVLCQQLQQMGLWRVYNEIDRPLLPVLLDMKLRGIAVNFDRVEQLRTEWTKRLVPLEKKAHEQAGKVFNLGSSVQVAGILYDDMGIVPPGYTKGGNPAADKDTLDQIDDVPLVDTILEWKALNSLITNVCNGLPKQRDKDTGRVHTELKITSTKTRRFSSAEPNLQNVPVRTKEGKEIRDAFIAERGNKIISADYSQIEYRVLAHVTMDPFLVNAFRNKIDMHAKMAADIFGGNWQDYNNKADEERYDKRGAMKNVNFATVYGAGPSKIARMSKIELTQALALLAAHEQMCPRVYEWKEEQWALARKHQYVENLFGGRTHVQYINSKNRELRGHAERLAINALIQGGAADLIRVAMPVVHNAIGYWKASLLLQVHDELVVECPTIAVEKVKVDVKRAMETCADDWVKWEVPIVAEVKAGNTWRGAK